MNQIYTFLKRRDLLKFNPHRRPPMTEAKKRIIADSQHPLHIYIIEAVTSGHFRQTLGEKFTFDALQRQLTKDGYGAQAKNAKEVGTALKSAGVTQVRLNVGGRKTRRYKLPSVAGGWDLGAATSPEDDHMDL
jgi:hypothetical protein